MIRFESELREARILSPLNNFELVTQNIEHRRDPLTKLSVVVLKGRMEYVRTFVESDQSFVDELVHTSAADCPFCPEATEKKAPRFMPEIAPEGRIQVGEAVCFPSLIAHNDFNALVVPSRRHNLKLNEFSAPMLTDAFKAAIQYFERVRAWKPEVKYSAIAINFLPPAGSTVAHFHIQLLASDVPFRSIEDLLDASKAYAKQYGSSYWKDLIDAEEHLASRYIERLGNVHWLTPFAPIGLNEAEAVVSGTSTLDQLPDTDIEGLAEGIARVTRFYHDIGVRSFNLAVYPGPLGESLDYYDMGLRIVSRYGYKPRFVSDAWALQYLLGEHEVYDAPEETCSALRKYFD
jgi:UDPglucose--hexose-1-phosphate uridylyltransferase